MTLVDSADVEMPQSLNVRLELDNTYDSRIRLNEDRAEGEVEILDDDGTQCSLLHKPLFSYVVL